MLRRLQPNTDDPSRYAALGALLLIAFACGGSGGDSVGTGRPRTSPVLRTFASEQELLATLRDNVRERTEAFLERALQPPSSHTMPIAAGAGQGTPTFSRTNTQEPDVDEPDIVKTDGQRIHLLNGDRLEILEVPAVGQLTHRGTLALEGEPIELLLRGDQAVVFTILSLTALPPGHALLPLAPKVPVGPAPALRSPLWTKVTVVDTSDPTAPAVDHEIFVEASYKTARQIGDAVRMITHAELHISGLAYFPFLPANYPALTPAEQERARIAGAAAASRANEQRLAATTLADFVPLIYHRTPGTALTAWDLNRNGARDFSVAADAFATGVTSVLTLGLTPARPILDTDHVIANEPRVYASPTTLLLAEPAEGQWWHSVLPRPIQPASNIHRFDISDPHATHYTGSGRVDGTIPSSFALSEHQGRIRAAATTQQPVLESHVYVLEGGREMSVVGHVGGLGIDETLWSCRFGDDECYVVTFETIDPLFVIDLSDPRRPRLRGELEVEGVSTYIHQRNSAGQLLTIGLNTNSEPTISLFDVRNPESPTLAARRDLPVPSQTGGWRRIWSQALFDPRAFNYWERLGLLAVPVDSGRWRPLTNTYENFSQLQLLAVGTNGTLQPYGAIDHAEFFNSAPGRVWNDTAIRRAIFFDDHVYAISNRAITAHDTATLQRTAVVKLPGE